MKAEIQIFQNMYDMSYVCQEKGSRWHLEAFFKNPGAQKPLFWAEASLVTTFLGLLLAQFSKSQVHLKAMCFIFLRIYITF